MTATVGNHNLLKLKPPLVPDEAGCDAVVAATDAALTAGGGRRLVNRRACRPRRSPVEPVVVTAARWKGGLR